MKAKDRYGRLPTSVLTAPPPSKDGSERTMDPNSSSRNVPSAFPDWLADFLLRYYNRAGGVVLDPFHGWGHRATACQVLGVPYVGLDIAPTALAESNGGVVLANSVRMPLANNSAAHLITSPPYWRVERYEPVPGQLSEIPTYAEFLQMLGAVVQECKRVLVPGALGCWMVADFRIRGHFYDLSTDLTNLHTANGATVWDKLVVDKSPRYRVPLFIPQADRLGYTVKVHEYVIVFRY